MFEGVDLTNWEKKDNYIYVLNMRLKRPNLQKKMVVFPVDKAFLPLTFRCYEAL